MTSAGLSKIPVGSERRQQPSPPKILLVDDLQPNLIALAGLLRFDGVELLQASSGEQALELLLQHEFALAILDVQMPGMNGFELATLMRGTERTRSIPIVFITAGVHDRQHRFKGYESGAVDFLFKPIEPDVLRYKTAVFLELHATRQQIARQRDELRSSHERLAAELEAAQLVQDLSTRLIRGDEPDTFYLHIVETARALMRADGASLHLVRPPAGLRLLAHRGLTAAAAQLLSFVDSSSASACAAAMRTGNRAFIADLQDRGFINCLLPHQVSLATEIRSMQSVPLRSRTGDVLGVISAVWGKPHEPDEAELRYLDVVARQAADLIERTNTVSALRETNSRLRFMAESMPQKIFTATADGAVDYFNQKWTEFTGLSLPELYRWGWKPCVHPDDEPESSGRWKHSLRTGDQFECEHRLRSSDGTYRWHLGRAQALRNSAGNIDMWIGSNTDIDAQKTTEADLRHLNEDLKQFAFAVSHDLQEPLRMISCYSELLVRSCPPETHPDQQVWMGYVREGAQRMTDLLRDLLAYTRVTSEQRASTDAADLNEALSGAIDNLRAAIDAAGAVIVADELPTVIGRETQLVQLFQNLVANALKYRSDLPPRIEIKAEQHSCEWIISVEDNGIGIAPQYHREIFGVFKRLHGRHISGNGIGLAICQRIVERCGGRIWVESELGRGARFRFSLPAVPSPQSGRCTSPSQVER